MNFKVAVEVGVKGSAQAAATVKADAQVMEASLGRVAIAEKQIGDAAGAAVPKIQAQAAASGNAARASDGLERELKQTGAELRQAGTAASTNARQVNESTVAATTAARAQDRLQGELAQTGTEFRQAGGQAESWGSRVRNAVSSMVGGAGFANLLAKITAIAAATLSMSAAFDVAGRSITAALDVNRMERGFGAIAGGAVGAGRELAFVRGESNRLGLELISTSDAWLKMAASAKGTALEGRGAREIFLGVAEASRALGLSSERTALSLRSIEQMMNKSTIMSEELKGQLSESLPGAYQIAARAMNLTTQELGKMLEQGEITAEVLLPKMAAELRKMYGAAAAEAGAGPSAQFARMRTAIFEAEAALGTVLLPSLGRTADAIAGLVSSNGMELFAKAAGLAVSGLVEIVGALIRNVEELALALTVLAASQIPAIVTGIRAIQAAFAALTATMYANPLVVVLAAVAAAFAVVNMGVKALGETDAEVTRSMVAGSERVRDSWLQTADAIEGADREAVASQAYLVESKLATARQQLEEIQVEFEAARKAFAERPVLQSGRTPGDEMRDQEIVDRWRAAQQVLSDQRGVVMSLTREFEALNGAKQRGIDGEGEYGAKVNDTIKALTSKLDGLVATRNELGLMGVPMESVKTKAEAMGRAVERISQLGIDPEGKAAEKIRLLEQAIAAASEEIRKAQDTKLEDKLQRQGDAAVFASEGMQRVAEKYRESYAAGQQEMQRLEAEAAVRARLRGATEDQIAAQVKADLAAAQDKQLVAAEAQLAQMREEAALREKVNQAYREGAKDAAQVEININNQIQLNQRLAGSLGDVRAQMEAALKAEADRQRELGLLKMRDIYAAELKQLKELIITYPKGAAAVAKLRAEQEVLAEVSKVTAGLTAEQKKLWAGLIQELEGVARATAKARQESAVLNELMTTQEELDLMQRKLAVRREDYHSLEAYRRALEGVTREVEIQRELTRLTQLGASPEQIASMEQMLRTIQKAGDVLEQRDVETAWQAGIRSMTETFETELFNAGKTAIEGWVEIGDSFVENLLEKLIEAFASAALQAAIASAFNGQGFWAGVSGALGGGGGAAGAGGGGGWLSTAKGAWDLYKNGQSAWGAVSGPNAPAWTSTFVNNGANGIYGPTASGGNLATGGLTTAGTAVAVAAVGLAIVAAFKIYLDKREEKKYKDVGQTFQFGYGMATPGTPGYTPPGSIPKIPGGSPGSGDSGGLTFFNKESKVGPIGNMNVAGVTTAGSLSQMIGAEEVEKLRKLIEDNTIGLVKSLGGVVLDLKQFNLNIRNDGKEFKITIDGIEKTFKTIDEALSHGITSMLAGGEFEGLSANVQAVLANANKIGLEGLQGMLDLAQKADAAISGSLSGVTPVVSEFEKQMEALKGQIAEQTAQGLKWGISLESLNALGEKQIAQLKQQQAAAAGQQVATVLDQLFALSPQAAADAELAMIYQQAVGAMRIAQLQMEADKLALLGYLTAEQMARIQGYINTLDAAGAGAAAIYGGGPAVSDPGAEQRQNRRDELWQLMRDLESGGETALGTLAAALKGARDLADEMRELNMGEIYAAKMANLATAKAAEDFMKPFEDIIAGAADGGAGDNWRKLGDRYDQFEADLLAGADQLVAAGIDVEAMLAQLRQAQSIEAQALGDDLLKTFGSPFLALRASATDLGDRLRLLAEMVAAGAVAAADAAEVQRHVANEAYANLTEGLLGTLEKYYGQVEGFEEIRAQLAEMRFSLEIAQYQLQFELIRNMGLLTAEQIANIEGLFAFIAANPPDFSRPPAPETTGGRGFPDIGPGIDAAANNLERLMGMLREWEDLALSPAERRLRDINERHREMLELAGRNQALIARVQNAYQLALKDFYDGLKAPLKDLLRDLGLGGRGSTATNRNQVLGLRAEYDALVARLSANPNDAAALERLNTVARAMLDSASRYGQDGALYASIAAGLQRTLPGILGTTLTGPGYPSLAAKNDNLPNQPKVDPLLSQARRDREEQSRENAAMLAALNRIERKIGGGESAAEVRDAVRELAATNRRRLAR